MALAYDLPVATRNAKHFRRVPAQTMIGYTDNFDSP